MIGRNLKRRTLFAIVSISVGILIFLFPSLLNTIVALYLIISGILELVDK